MGDNVITQWHWKQIVSSVMFLGGIASAASAHSIVEIHKNPSAFDQQSVTVTGETANVVTRYGDVSYTTFDLVDANGVVLAVLVSQIPTCLQGDTCRVTGLFVAEKNMVLPEKVERVDEGEYKEAGVLFHQHRSPVRPGGPMHRNLLAMPETGAH
jgi:hypothetical protein